MSIKNVTVGGKMINGIDGIIQGDTVTMTLTDEELVITNGIITRCIKHEDVLGAKTVDDVNVQHQYVSSIGGAVLGGALFGVAGAAVGGRAKKKQIKSVDTWLIITYKEGEQPKNIAVVTTDLKYPYIINKYTKPVQTSTTAKKITLEPKKKKSGCLVAFLIIGFVCFAIMTGITNENKAKQNDTEQTNTANQETTATTAPVSKFSGDCGIVASGVMGENSIGYPTLTISVENVSGKTISAIKFYAIPYDVYGEEITGWTTQSGLYTDDPIEAGKSKDLTYQFIEDRLKYVELYVYSVFFEDGTEWGDKDANKIIAKSNGVKIEVGK